jgi:hypothetical protein
MHPEKVTAEKKFDECSMPLAAKSKMRLGCKRKPRLTRGAQKDPCDVTFNAA